MPTTPLPKALLLSQNIRMTSVDTFLNLLSSYNEENSISVDLKSITFIELVPLNILLAQVRYWKIQNKDVALLPNHNGDVHSYMQRMDFYNLCGLNMEENFIRQEPQGRFSVIKLVKHGNVEKFSTDIADIIAPSQKDEVDPSKTGFYDFVQYAVSELINNVTQHAKGEGFISAQHYPNLDGMVQICIADTGMGIRNSFLNSESPLSREASTDKKAIELALTSETSSKTHIKDPLSGETENQGVGLTILREIIVQTGSDFVIVSGSAGIYISDNNEREFTLSNPYQGTIVGFSFHRSKMSKYEELLEGAKAKHGLGLSEIQEAFSSIFGDGE